MRVVLGLFTGWALSLILSGLALGQETPAQSEKTLSATQKPEAKPKTEVIGEWVSLFNGKDLTGWTPKIRYHELGDNFGNTFRVEDGLLKVRYDGYEKFGAKFGHLFYETPYSSYDFRVKYRFVGEQCGEGPGWAIRNSGVMVHGQSAESMTKDQDFPVSIEVQLLGGDGTNDRPTANLCTPGTHVEMAGELIKRHCTNSTAPTFHGEGWVTVTIEVRGNKVIRHLVNDKVVLEYNRPQLDPNDKSAEPLIVDGKVQLEGGTISLQSESHPIDFQTVEIRVVKDEK